MLGLRVAGQDQAPGRVPETWRRGFRQQAVASAGAGGFREHKTYFDRILQLSDDPYADLAGRSRLFLKGRRYRHDWPVRIEFHPPANTNPEAAIDGRNQGHGGSVDDSGRRQPVKAGRRRPEIPGKMRPRALRGRPGFVATIVCPSVRIGRQAFAAEFGMLPEWPVRPAGQPELHDPAGCGDDHRFHESVAEQDAVGPPAVVDRPDDDLPQVLRSRVIDGRDRRIWHGDTRQRGQQTGRATGRHGKFLKACFMPTQDLTGKDVLNRFRRCRKRRILAQLDRCKL